MSPEFLSSVTTFMISCQGNFSLINSSKHVTFWLENQGDKSYKHTIFCIPLSIGSPILEYKSTIQWYCGPFTLKHHVMFA